MRVRLAAITTIALLILIAVGRRDAATATSLAPTQGVTLSDSTTSANAQVTVSFSLAAPDSWHKVSASFIPPAFTVAAGGSVPNGALVSTLQTASSYTNNNGPCSASTLVSYTTQDASTDTSITVADTPRIPDPGWPGFADSNGNTLMDAVDKYPNFLKTLYPGLTPRARQFGYNDTSNRVVNVLIFEPGTALPGMPAFSASLGYPAVIVEQDPTTPPAPSSRGDSCTTLDLFRIDKGLTQDNPATPAANEGGVVYRANPATNSTQTFVTYVQSLRDRDDDGIENALDSCPADPDPTWNPRGSDPSADPDGDGIPSTCDPTDFSANSDPDGDSYENRQDNCPLAANASQADGDGDNIGDACDSQPAIADGHVHEACATADVQIGSGGAPPSLACPDALPDEDFDGFRDTDEAQIGTSAHDPCGGTGWPADLDPNNMLDIGDFNSFVFPMGTDDGHGAFAYFGHPVLDPGRTNEERWNLSPNEAIDIADINAINPAVSASTSRPPMLGGTPAFAQSCPYAP